MESFRREFADKSYFLALKKSGNYYFNDILNTYKNRQFRYTLDPTDPENQCFYKTIKQEEPCLINVDYDEKIFVTKV